MGEKKIKEIEQKWLSTKDIANRVGRSTETIRREIKRGKLSAHKFNEDYMILATDFEQWEAKYFKPVG